MKIFLSTKANRQLNKLPQSMHGVLYSQIKKLSIIPFPQNSKKLTGRNGWKVRVGDYRTLYTVNQKLKEITILSIAHRREAYR